MHQHVGVCRLAVSEELKRAKCDMPDILSMAMCSRYAGDSAAARACAVSMPPQARALVRSATYASEAPLLSPLPHTSAIVYLQRAKKPVPRVRVHVNVVLCWRARSCVIVNSPMNARSLT